MSNPTVTAEEIVFAQVKTRDRGAWSAAKVLAEGGGIDALIRSYAHAKDAGCLDHVRLELILEGMESDRSDTTTFFGNPSSASDAQCKGLNPNVSVRRGGGSRWRCDGGCGRGGGGG